MMFRAHSESGGAALARYRSSLPLLGAGTYAALVSTLPARSPLGWGATVAVALGALWLTPIIRARRWQGFLGVYLFVSAIGLNAFLFSGPRSVPALFRVLGWVAFALTWGGLASGDAKTVESAAYASLPPSPLEKVLAPRRSVPGWPIVSLLIVAISVLGLFLWPTGALVPARAVLLQTGIVALGAALLGMGAEALADVVLLEEGLPRRLAPALLGLASAAIAVVLASRAVWGWVHGRDAEALAASALAGLLLGAVLRFRRFPRTKIEL